MDGRCFDTIWEWSCWRVEKIWLSFSFSVNWNHYYLNVCQSQIDWTLNFVLKTLITCFCFVVWCDIVAVCYSAVGVYFWRKLNPTSVLYMITYDCAVFKITVGSWRYSGRCYRYEFCCFPCVLLLFGIGEILKYCDHEEYILESRHATVL